MKTAMKALMKQLMITSTKAPRGNVVTICNYEEYQDPKNYEGTDENITKAPPKAPRSPEAPTSISKEVKNTRTNIKTSPSDKPEAPISKYNFDSFHKGLAERMASPVQQRFPKQNIKIEVWADAVRKLIMIDNRTREEIINVWAWIVNHDDGGFSWADQIRTPMKLRQTDKQDMKYFDVITSKMQGSSHAGNQPRQNSAAADRAEISRQLSDPDYALSKWNG